MSQTRACSKSVLGGIIRPVTPVLFISSPVMYSDDSVTFDPCFTRTLTFDSSFLYFDPMYENERNLVENNSYCKYDIVPLLSR